MRLPRYPQEQTSPGRSAGPKSPKGLNRSRGRALRRAAWPWMDDGSVLRDDEGPEAYPQKPMMVQHDDRAISHRQRWERSFEYPNRCDWRCSHDIYGEL